MNPIGFRKASRKNPPHQKKIFKGGVFNILSLETPFALILETFPEIWIRSIIYSKPAYITTTI